MSKETQRTLEAAIDAHVRDLFGEGAVTADYIVGAQYNTLDLVDDKQAGYLLEYPDDAPYHRPLGLLDYWSSRMRLEAGQSEDL